MSWEPGDPLYHPSRESVEILRAMASLREDHPGKQCRPDSGEWICEADDCSARWPVPWKRNQLEE